MAEQTPTQKEINEQIQIDDNMLVNLFVSLSRRN